jgi:DHA1 family bicyclomycin/chloramphenicol resistance-like MFS transporter
MGAVIAAMGIGSLLCATLLVPRPVAISGVATTAK